MQQWEYKVFASHLDPAELVLLLDESGREGWELITLVAVSDLLPVEVLEPVPVVPVDVSEPGPNPPTPFDEAADILPLQTFRYIFKRPLSL
jgi:hypothetical protein